MSSKFLDQRIPTALTCTVNILLSILIKSFLSSKLLHYFLAAPTYEYSQYTYEKCCLNGCGSDIIETTFAFLQDKLFCHLTAVCRSYWGGGALGKNHRAQTESQWPLSGVHSIMMVKSAQPGEGGGCTPSPFTLPSTITSKGVVYATLQRRGQITEFTQRGNGHFLAHLQSWW